MDLWTIVVVTIAVALVFDVINGFHDAANSIATVVSTRVLSPRMAVLWAALANFIALFIFKEGVADTIAKTINIDTEIITKNAAAALRNVPAWTALAKPASEVLRHTYVWIVICGLSG